MFLNVYFSKINPSSSFLIGNIFKRKAGISFITLVCFLFQSFLFPIYAGLDHFKSLHVEQTASSFLVQGFLKDDGIERSLTPQSPSVFSESADSLGYSDSDSDSANTPLKTPRSYNFGVFDLGETYTRETKHFSDVAEGLFTAYETTEKGLIFEIFSHDVLILSLLAQRDNCGAQIVIFQK